jgi:hypothetical protein
MPEPLAPCPCGCGAYTTAARPDETRREVPVTDVHAEPERPQAPASPAKTGTDAPAEAMRPAFPIAPPPPYASTVVDGRIQHR